MTRGRIANALALIANRRGIAPERLVAWKTPTSDEVRVTGGDGSQTRLTRREDDEETL